VWRKRMREESGKREARGGKLRADSRCSLFASRLLLPTSRFLPPASRFLLLASSLFLLSCTNVRRDWRPDEITLIAWYVEDIAHGAQRVPGELVTPDASEALKRIYVWSRPSAGERQPRQLESRRTRWPALRALIGEGAVATNKAGFLVVTGEASTDEARIGRELVAAENTDRQSIDLMMLSLAKTNDAGARRYAEAVTSARKKMDAVTGSTRR
jgi:hypothetical protein